MNDVTIVCRYCGHGKHWHRDEGPCRAPEAGRPGWPYVECDCPAWDYGVRKVTDD